MRLPLLLISMALISACATTLGPTTDENLTVGTVQREVYIGMSGAEVAEVLGSPNIVTTDENRNETWVYDKISSQSVTTDTSGAVAILRFMTDIGPIAASSRSRSESSSQRTLTVVIKFDESDKVRDFAYHTSRF
jgi:outer membrane protein assembly factor BamE (lipoprotein component of BamABCDE complex)